MKCRDCGCTRDNACALIFKGKVIGSCSWAERNLCTACVPTSMDPRQLQLPADNRRRPRAHWRSAPVIR
jgi:hypothetical protein